MIKNLFLTTRFFILFGGVIMLFVAAFSFQWLFGLAQTSFVLAIALVIADYMLLFNKGITIRSQRRLPKLFSLGDPNRVILDITNESYIPLSINVIDELPFQFQKRDFEIDVKIGANETLRNEYNLTPTERGEYRFGHTNIFATSMLGLVQRRFQAGADALVPVYPSVVQMKRYELLAFKQIANDAGIKKIRRIGHSYEFEQIKNYTIGDDFRSVNWKASSRRAQLMVNQFEDEKSQQVYCILDKSRVMRLPFGGLTLLDHAINATLTISNIILHKKDKAGIISFSDKLGTTLAAENAPNQLSKILAELYREKEGKGEASYELLYYAVRRLIKGRSLIILFTNFESEFALERVLPTLRLLSNMHLLLVVFFTNTEIEEFAKKPARTTEEIYQQTIARKFLSEKVQMQQRLRQHGIQTILTRPEDLSINTINKYLELKSRGLI